MSGIFSAIGMGPTQSPGVARKIGEAEPGTPRPPTVDEAAESQAAKDAARRRRGMAASVLTSPQGVSSESVGKKTLLGA